MVNNRDEEKRKRLIDREKGEKKNDREKPIKTEMERKRKEEKKRKERERKEKRNWGVAPRFSGSVRGCGREGHVKKEHDFAIPTFNIHV